MTGTLIVARRISRYTTKTIRVSDDYHRWIKAHNEDGETMEETLRRLTRGPHPGDVAGLLTEAEAEDAKERIEAARAGDVERLDQARDAFDSE